MNNLDNWKNLLSKILNELKLKALEFYGEKLVSLVVFGSVAKGVASPESDIDILIILEQKPESSYETYMEYYMNIEDSILSLKEAQKSGLNILISPVFFRKKDLKPEISFLWDGDFWIIYDKDVFFEKFVEKELKPFKKKYLLYHKKPMPYYSIKR